MVMQFPLAKFGEFFLSTCLYIYSFHTFTSEAVVGLERMFYQVREDVGVVEVCAIVYSPTIVCPINFPFNVSLSTSDNTAGIFLLKLMFHSISMLYCV